VALGVKGLAGSLGMGAAVLRAASRQAGGRVRELQYSGMAAAAGADARRA
jgi:hypothetical protein